MILASRIRGINRRSIFRELVICIFIFLSRSLRNFRSILRSITNSFFSGGGRSGSFRNGIIHVHSGGFLGGFRFLIFILFWSIIVSTVGAVTVGECFLRGGTTSWSFASRLASSLGSRRFLLF